MVGTTHSCSVLCIPHKLGDLYARWQRGEQVGTSCLLLESQLVKWLCDGCGRGGLAFPFAAMAEDLFTWTHCLSSGAERRHSLAICSRN